MSVAAVSAFVRGGALRVFLGGRTDAERAVYLARIRVAASGTAARVAAGAKAAAEAAAGPKPFVDIVCPIMQQQAEARGLPPMAFVRLIWRESRFNPRAESHKGAQGIAQR